MGRSDVAIVGGGVGGLTCAAFLARQGVRVELHERQERFGGLARSVRVGDRQVPANFGRTEGFDAGDPKVRILEHLGVLDSLRAEPLEWVCEVRGGDGFRLALPAGFAAVREVLVGAFPEEARAIGGVLDVYEGVASESERLSEDEGGGLWRVLAMPFRYRRLFRLRRRPLGSWLRERVRGPRARLVLGALAPLWATSAEDVAAAVYGTAAAAMFRRPMRLAGGGRSLVLALTEAARSAGAVFEAGSAVTEVAVRGRQAVGIRTAGGEVPARVVVSNASPVVTFGALVAREAVTAGFLQRVGQMRASASASVLLLVLRARRDALAAAADLLLVHAGDDPEAHARAVEEETTEGRILVVALHPADGGDPDVTLATVVVPDRVARWTDPSRREALAAETEATLMARLGFLHPDLRSVVAASRLLTPLDLVDWSGDPEGSVRGWDPSPGQWGPDRPGVSSPVEGLVLTGACGASGAGYGGTMVSGFMAGLQCAVALGRRVRM
jgi:prolycopene isomerase